MSEEMKGQKSCMTMTKVQWGTLKFKNLWPVLLPQYGRSE